MRGDARQRAPHDPRRRARADVAIGLVVAGAGSAALVARIHRRDVRAAICGAGLRDPALAGALAYLAAGPDALGVPVVYAVAMAVVAAIALRRPVRSG
ncbi:MAG: hypothetical protein AAB295_11525 [Chloroflexota bacterium]